MDVRELVARRLIVGLGGELEHATVVADRAEQQADSDEDISTARALALLEHMGTLIEDVVRGTTGGTGLLLDCLEQLVALRVHLPAMVSDT